MTYSEEEIQKYLNILHSVNCNYNNTVFYDTIPLKTPVIIVVILILSKMVVLDTVINIFIQMVMLLLKK